jgi:hypothetical protein
MNWIGKNITTKYIRSLFQVLSTNAQIMLLRRLIVTAALVLASSPAGPPPTAAAGGDRREGVGAGNRRLVTAKIDGVGHYSLDNDDNGPPPGGNNGSGRGTLGSGTAVEEDDAYRPLSPTKAPITDRSQLIDFFTPSSSRPDIAGLFASPHPRIKLSKSSF